MKMENKTQYTCPMHPEVVKDAPGKCPKCGMNLVPIKTVKTDYTEHHTHLSEPASGPSAPGEVRPQYYCTMLCEGDKKYPAPGNCPVCGMYLVATSGVPSGTK
jgi:Cu2+-exporting ATPase